MSTIFIRGEMSKNVLMCFKVIMIDIDEPIHVNYTITLQEMHCSQRFCLYIHTSGVQSKTKQTEYLGSE